MPRILWRRFQSTKERSSSRISRKVRIKLEVPTEMTHKRSPWIGLPQPSGIKGPHLKPRLKASPSAVMSLGALKFKTQLPLIKNINLIRSAQLSWGAHQTLTQTTWQSGMWIGTLITMSISNLGNARCWRGIKSKVSSSAPPKLKPRPWNNQSSTPSLD